MKIIRFIILAVISNLSALFSQNEFLLASQAGYQTILLNGKKYNIDSAGTKIKTKFPNFDTLTFLTETANSNVAVICNFKPDSCYFITFSCCASLDLIPKSKFKCDSLKHWDGEKDVEKLKNQLLDKPFISIRTRNVPKDSIYAWHSDAACITEHKLINTDLWRLGVPPKCFYWTNITPILFFKTDANSKQKRNKDVEEFLGKKSVIELATIYLRLFDNQKFILTFDEQKKSVQIAYE